MQKLALIMAALMMLVTRAVTEDADHTIIGGADGPTAIYLKKTSEPAFGSITLSFDANITTGYEWKASVVGGDSVEIDMDGSGYRADPSADPLACGTGGTCVFKLNALKPGESIFRFTYSREWENEPIQELYMLAVVEDDLLIYTIDITETGVYDGTVTHVDAADHSVTLITDRLGEVTARFNEKDELPAQGEPIMVYTNGTMIMPLPAIMDVIAWSSLFSDETGCQ